MALFTTFSTHDDGDMKHPAVQLSRNVSQSSTGRNDCKNATGSDNTEKSELEKKESHKRTRHTHGRIS